MRYLFLNLIVGFLFAFQQFLGAAGQHWSIDLILPTFLWFTIFDSISFKSSIFIFLWAVVVDSFSSKLPGPTIFAYFISIYLVDQLRIHFDIESFLPYCLVLFFGILLGEILRLLVLPTIFDFPLPGDIMIHIFFTTIFSLMWSFILRSLSCYRIWRDIFAF